MSSPDSQRAQIRRITSESAKLVFAGALLLVTSSSSPSIRAAEGDSLGSHDTLGPISAFSTYQSFDTGTDPQSVVAADIDGDGKIDVIVANFFDNTVSILRNTTPVGFRTLSFANQQTFATGSSPQSVAIADVNGDGKPDLVVVDRNANTLSVLLNSTVAGASTFTFAARQTFATGSVPYSVTVADLNGDGKPDVIVANSLGNNVSVLLDTTVNGAPTVTFTEQQTIATGTNPHSVSSADINGDGKPDLVVANFDDGTVSVLLNTTVIGSGLASFAQQVSFMAGAGSGSVVAADLNSDGKPDVVVANSSNNTVSVLINATAVGAATPTFMGQQSFDTGSFPQSVAVADVDGNGTLDLIVANSDFNTLSVLLNTTVSGSTTPTFARQKVVAARPFPDSVTTADINADGAPDLIVSNGNDASVSVFLNTPPNDDIFADGFD